MIDFNSEKLQVFSALCCDQITEIINFFNYIEWLANNPFDIVCRQIPQILEKSTANKRLGIFQVGALDVVEQIKTICPRHADVCNYNVQSCLLQDADPFFSRTGCVDITPHVTKNLLPQLAQIDFIVNHKNAWCMSARQNNSDLYRKFDNELSVSAVLIINELAAMIVYYPGR